MWTAEPESRMAYGKEDGDEGNTSEKSRRSSSGENRTFFTAATFPFYGGLELDPPAAGDLAAGGTEGLPAA